MEERGTADDRRKEVLKPTPTPKADAGTDRAERSWECVHGTGSRPGSTRQDDGAERDVLRSESRLSRFASELWTPYLRGTALRVFASGSITAQVGVLLE